jgi:hypothetical protein
MLCSLFEMLPYQYFSKKFRDFLCFLYNVFFCVRCLKCYLISISLKKFVIFFVSFTMFSIVFVVV